MKSKLSGLMVIALLFALTTVAAGRNISIAGLVVDAKTLQPLVDAKIFNEKGTQLGATDTRGYYKIVVSYGLAGDIKFGLVIKATGYETITQKEHWGNLSDGSGSLYYFGLKPVGSSVSSFAKLVTSVGSNISYADVNENFKEVITEKVFDDKIAAAKLGNQNVLVQVDGKYYIVDAGGWIKLSSSKDLVIIDNKAAVTADKLNGLLKRSQIKGMTPLNSKPVTYAITTK